MADKNNNKKSKYIFLILRLVFVAVGLTLGILWLSGAERWQNLKKVFAQIHIWAFAMALGAFFLGQLIVASRWWLLLRAQKIFIPVFDAVKLHFLGLFYNNFMPSSIGGDVIRAWYVTKHTDRRFHAALSVFVDRLLATFSMAFLVLISWSFLLKTKGPDIEFNAHKKVINFFADNGLTILSAFGILVLFIVILFSIPATRPAMLKILKKFYGAFGQFFHKFLDAFKLYSKNPLTLIGVFALTIINQSIVIVAFWFVARDLQIFTELKYFFIFFPASWVFGALPISLGGAVVVEGGLVLLFTKFTSVTAEQALAIALLQRIVWMIASVPGIFIHLMGKHLPKNFTIDSNDGIN